MLNTTLSVLSILVSAGFIWAGGSMLLGEGVPSWIRVFGVFALGYGLITVALLLAAWLRASPAIQTVSKYLSLLFLVTFVASSMDVGMISGLEWVGIVLVAFMLWIHWFAVKKVVEREKGKRTLEFL